MAPNLASWCLQAAPDEALKLMLQPLLQQLESDLGDGEQVVSRVSSKLMLPSHSSQPCTYRTCMLWG